MQDNIRQLENRGTTHLAEASPSIDTGASRPVAMGCSLFPKDAVARIYKPSRSPMTSGKARTKGWRLTFERRTAPVSEPLMGWTSGDDTLTQVELSFPTLKSAIRYAERQGLHYTVQSSDNSEVGEQRMAQSVHAFSDATLQKLGLTDLEQQYWRAIDGAASRNDPPGPGTWASPMGVVCDRTLALDAKRSIPINLAWMEYLIDQTTNEGMPEDNRPSRLDEVKQALLALERSVANDRSASSARKAA